MVSRIKLNIKNPVVLIYIVFISCTQAPGDDVFILQKPPAVNSEHKRPVIYWRESWSMPRPVQFHFMRIDLHSPVYEVFTMVSDDPDSSGPAEAQLQDPVELADRFRAVAAVNANAFRYLPGTDEAESRKGYIAGKMVDIAGLAGSNGDIRSQSERSLSAFWIDKAGRPHIGNPADIHNVFHGVSDWIDRLLIDGESVVKSSEQLHPRTLAGIDISGRYLLLVVADGRQYGYSEGISLHEAAVLMKDHGCHDAVNLDGGGSSIMLIAGKHQMNIMNRPSGGSPRPIPVMLGIRKRVQSFKAAPR